MRVRFAGVLVCAVCATSFEVTKPYLMKVAKLCSASCRQKYNARKQTGNSLRYTGQGVSYVKLKGRHMHRVLAEEKIGRALIKGEVVHHIDGNKRNNSPDNLEVLKNQSEHAKLHDTLARLQRSRKNTSKCIQSGCDYLYYCKGYCKRHYMLKWKDMRRK